MTKEELIKKIAEKSKASEADVLKIMEVFTEQIKDQVKKGEKVVIPGFGTFVLEKDKADVSVE